MRNRINKYHIKVEFDKKRQECQTGDIRATYPFSQGYEDDFDFSNDHFTIVADRSKVHPDGEILSTSANTLNTQILKGLLYYYAIANDFPRIKKISITLSRARKADFAYTECNNLTQPIVNPGQKVFAFNANDIKIIFDETDKARAIRIALSYWLTGTSTQERYYRFDRLWRSFNRLFMYQGNSIKEFDCMKAMRQFIIDNPLLFPQTLSITDAYTPQELRTFKWRQMILNDFATQTKTKAFHDFILRNHDVHIMDLFNETLPYRIDYLTAEGLDTAVTSHIAANRNPAPVEKIPLLAIKYAYFIRNKMFHGEIPDSTFKVHTDENDILIDRLNTILSTLIFELITHSPSLR